MKHNKIYFFACFIIIFFSCNDHGTSTLDNPKKDSLVIGVDEQIKKMDSLSNLVNTFEKISLTDRATISLEDRAKAIQLQLIAQCPSLSIASLSGAKKRTRTYYIVEGDILLDRDELYIYCQERLQNIDTNVTQRRNANKLTVATDPNDSLLIWERGKVLKYSIARNTFSSQSTYNTVVKNFREACENWMQVCNIKFEYHPEFDEADDIDLEFDTITKLTFLVREINAGSKFIAKAFFPNDLPYKRTVLIDPSYFTTQADKTGVFRHELGHVLGWRHEQIWSKDSDCQGEQIIEREFHAQPLTQYDPYSVMHYICGEKLKSKDFKLLITEFDKIGAQKVYGPPAMLAKGN